MVRFSQSNTYHPGEVVEARTADSTKSGDEKVFRSEHELEDSCSHDNQDISIEQDLTYIESSFADYANVSSRAIDAVGHTPTTSANWSTDRRKSIAVFMKHKKAHDRFPLGEDVYAFLFVAPICSLSFCFSCAVVALKFVVYSVLSSDINMLDFNIKVLEANVAKFFLIPVAVAMQEDLMHAYFFFANVFYCPSALEVSKSATRCKLYFSYIVRTMDGVFSLFVNFSVMLSTDKVLDVFLNFAALGFLQSIDDVFYELVVRGFFGDKMEHMSLLSKQITFPRRMGKDNTKLFGFFRMSHLDSFLFGGTMVLCLSLYILNTITVYDVFDNHYYEDLANATNATLEPSIAPSWENYTLDNDDTGDIL